MRTARRSDQRMCSVSPPGRVQVTASASNCTTARARSAGGTGLGLRKKSNQPMRSSKIAGPRDEPVRAPPVDLMREWPEHILAVEAVESQLDNLIESERAPCGGWDGHGLAWPCLSSLAGPCFASLRRATQGRGPATRRKQAAEVADH